MGDGGDERKRRGPKFGVPKLPFNKPLLQQTMKVWEPKYQFKYVIGILSGLGLFCLIVGPIALAGSRSVTRQSIRYDNYQGCQYNTTCHVPLQLDDEMKAPVYVYYELDNFFQNHRDYVKSVTFKQIRGVSLSTSDCEPLQKYRDGFGGENNVNLRDKKLYPCGLIASSFFRDQITASLYDSSGNLITPLTGADWQKEGIAWSSDKDHRYKDQPITPDFTKQSPYGGGFEMPSVEDEDFIVWMRTASRPRFTKLYRQILSRDLQAGQVLNFTIVNNVDQDAFNGKKFLVVSTASWVGGANDFLGVAYCVIGCISLVLAMAFGYLYLRQEGKVPSIARN